MLEPDDATQTRASLLVRLKDWEDRVSWEDFFEKYWKLIYSVGRKSGLSETEAHDLVQDTVLCVAKKMPEFRYDPATGSFKSWLMQITRRRIVDQLRKNTRHVPLCEVDQNPSAGTGMMERLPDTRAIDIGDVCEQEWQKHLFDCAINNLKPRLNPIDFQIFDLAVLKGLKTNEIARILKVSSARVYLMKHRISKMVVVEARSLEASLENEAGNALK